MKKLLFLLILLAFYGCTTYAFINFENASADTLYIAISKDDFIEHSERITMNGEIPKKACTREVLPGETDYITRLGTKGWIRFVEHSDGDKVRVFIINKKDFDNNSLEEISQKKLYKKSEYSLQELKDSKWNIILK